MSKVEDVLISMCQNRGGKCYASVPCHRCDDIKKAKQQLRQTILEKTKKLRIDFDEEMHYHNGEWAFTPRQFEAYIEKVVKINKEIQNIFNGDK